MQHSTYVRGIFWGMVGGLAGTIAMSLLGVGIFTIMELPVDTSFTIIGDSAAAFFTKLGIALAGGDRTGMSLYCLIGLVFGAMLGTGVVGLEPLKRASIKKRVGLSILFVEVMSLPLLLAATLSLKMSTASAALWFGISFVMHLVYGLVLGLVLNLGSDRRNRGRQK